MESIRLARLPLQSSLGPIGVGRFGAARGSATWTIDRDQKDMADSPIRQTGLKFWLRSVVNYFGQVCLRLNTDSDSGLRRFAIFLRPPLP
jgi:hypothetical protein